MHGNDLPSEGGLSWNGSRLVFAGSRGSEIEVCGGVRVKRLVKRRLMHYLRSMAESGSEVSLKI